MIFYFIISNFILIQIKGAITFQQADQAYFDASQQNFTKEDISSIYKKYSNQLLPKYILDLELTSVQITLILEQCTWIKGPNCFAANLTDQTTIIGGPDMRISFKSSNYIVQCQKKWMFKGVCGTYLEIHKPLDQTIIYEKRVQVINATSFVSDYLLTKQLCAGKYEIWWVIRARVGSIIQVIKPFYVDLPSC